jgi:hypothetical protein
MQPNNAPPRKAGAKASLFGVAPQKILGTVRNYLSDAAANLRASGRIDGQPDHPCVEHTVRVSLRAPPHHFIRIGASATKF